MTVAFDAVSSSTTASPGPDTWTHTPVGTPRGVLVFLATGSNNSQYVYTDVTYGGVPMVRAPVTFIGTAEAGSALIYFLGSGIPAGAQTVSVDYASNPGAISVFAVTVTAAGDTHICDFDSLSSASLANPAIELSSGAASALRFIGGLTGNDSANTIAMQSGTTKIGSQDAGSRGFVWGYETTASTGDTSVGFTIAADDVNMVAVAVTDEAATDPVVDAWSEFPTIAGVTNVPDPFTWTHRPIGDPAGVAVLVYQANDFADTITGVTYGGTAMTRIDAEFIDATEDGGAYLYFLGSSIPTGAQTVSIDHTAGAAVKWGAAVTFAAGGDTEVVASSTLAAASQVNPSISLDSSATSTARVFAAYSGLDDAAVASTNSVQVVSNDRGSQGWLAFVTPQPTTGSQAIGYIAAADEVAAVAAAIGLAATPPSAPTNPAATALSSSTIRVTWDDVADETGYRVERSPDGSGSWTDVSGNLAADTVSYDDTGLTASTQYFYRVYAFNADGDSDPSATVNATTDAAGGGGNRMGGDRAIRRPPRYSS